MGRKIAESLFFHKDFLASLNYIPWLLEEKLQRKKGFCAWALQSKRNLQLETYCKTGVLHFSKLNWNWPILTQGSRRMVTLKFTFFKPFVNPVCSCFRTTQGPFVSLSLWSELCDFCWTLSFLKSWSSSLAPAKLTSCLTSLFFKTMKPFKMRGKKSKA